MEKIKSWSQMANTNRHNNRMLKVENADKDRHIKLIIGSNDLIRDVKRIMEKYSVDTKKLRKDAVLANELVFSLSKEFFTSSELNYKNTFNLQKIKEFNAILKKHLKEKFGDKVAQYILHLDEGNVHAHVVVVPITGEGKLSSRDFFNRKALVNLQKDYCNAFAESELKNDFKFSYVEKSTATHQTLNEYYYKANQAKKNEEKITQLESEIIILKSKSSNQEELIELQNKNNKLKKECEITKFKLETTEKLIVEKDEKISKLTNIIDGLKYFVTVFCSDKLKYLGKGLLKSLNLNSEEKEYKTEINKQLEEYNEITEEVIEALEEIDELKPKYKHLYKPELTYKPKKPKL